MKSKIILLSADAPCSFLLCPCAEAQQPAESPADRIPNWSLPFHCTRPASRHSGRVCASLGTWRGKTLSLSGDMLRENSIAFPRLLPSCASQGRCHRHGRSGSNPCRQGSDYYDSYCHGAGYRSCWQWVRRQPCAAWRKHHRIVTLAPELSGKRLELLKEIIPKLSRVAVFGTSTNPGNAQLLKEMELAARRSE